jgi:hypothetical protein
MARRVTTDTGQAVVMLIRVVKGWPVPAFIFPADWRPASDHSEPPAPTAGIVGRQRMRFGFVREICQRST